MRSRVAKKVLAKKDSLKYNKWQLSEAQSKVAKTEKRGKKAAASK